MAEKDNEKRKEKGGEKKTRSGRVSKKPRKLAEPSS